MSFEAPRALGHVWLGAVPHADARALQQRVAHAQASGELDGDCLLLVEHGPDRLAAYPVVRGVTQGFVAINVTADLRARGWTPGRLAGALALGLADALGLQLAPANQRLLDVTTPALRRLTSMVGYDVSRPVDASDLASRTASNAIRLVTLSGSGRDCQLGPAGPGHQAVGVAGIGCDRGDVLDKAVLSGGVGAGRLDHGSDRRDPLGRELERATKARR